MSVQASEVDVQDAVQASEVDVQASEVDVQASEVDVRASEVDVQASNLPHLHRREGSGLSADHHRRKLEPSNKNEIGQ